MSGKAVVERDRGTVVTVAVVGLIVVVALADRIAPLGLAVWIFYLAPLALCLFQERARLPFVVAALGTVAMYAGYYLSPAGVLSTEVAALNRVFGTLTLWGVAWVTVKFLHARARADDLVWVQQGRVHVAQAMLGDKASTALADGVLRSICEYCRAGAGVLHLRDNGAIVRVGAWAGQEIVESAQRVPIGVGLLGQAVRDNKEVLLHTVPEGYLTVQSGLGRMRPTAIAIVPLTAEGEVIGAIEVALTPDSVHAELVAPLLRSVAEAVGTAFRSALYRQQLQELLEETQRQSEVLQSQQEELRASNEQLEQQSEELRTSQARLELQQTELEESNSQLESQTARLEEQRNALLDTQSALKANAEALERASQYKSEFLANMSHELRTPLNSSMILSQLLAENRDGNLTDEQVRHARIILSANQDLLALINDILDLSKIEAGRVEMTVQPVAVTQVIEPVVSGFLPVAAQRGLTFRSQVAPDAPGVLVTDTMRVQQILKNLLSNAFKFTSQGEVALTVKPVGRDEVAFEVSDTGIGIAPEQQAVIFEAFRQADGTTSRKYGGTGLGLSISRQLAALLGGSIEVDSAVGRGSRFTFRCPRVVQHPSSGDAATQTAEQAPLNRPIAAFKQASVAPAVARTSAEGDIASEGARSDASRVILIVEDDAAFAEILQGLCRDMGFDALIAGTGAAAFELASSRRPSAILLDVGLPDTSGLALLEQLKRNPVTRPIPVHVVSIDDYTQVALELGAVGYALKPVAREELIGAIERLQSRLDREVKRVLVVEDDEKLRLAVGELLSSDGVEIRTVSTVSGALAALADTTFDCMVMDLVLPDASGYDLLEKMAAGGPYAFPPVIVYTGRNLTRDEEQRLRRFSQSIILKGARSPERLLDEVGLFLHQVESRLPPDRQRMLRDARRRDAAFEGRTILLAEDDVRNVFSMTSIFEPLGARLLVARNGVEALQLLESKPVDLVLMDIMMPEMDGHTAMSRIRTDDKHRRLPIIALTANAMPEDRRRAIDAGANDYVAKPVDIDKLVSLCRVWMPK